MTKIENVTARATIKYRGVEGEIEELQEGEVAYKYKGENYFTFSGFCAAVDKELLKEFDEAEHLSRSERALKYLVGKEVVAISKISGVHRIGVLEYHGDGVCTVGDFGLDCDDIDTCHVVVIDASKIDEDGKAQLGRINGVRGQVSDLRRRAYSLECEVKDLVAKFVEKYGN